MAIAEKFISPVEDLAWVETPTSAKVSTLAREFEYWKTLFSIQESETRSQIFQQAQLIAAALIKRPFQVRLNLPDEVCGLVQSEKPGSSKLHIPAEMRQVLVGRWQSRDALKDIVAAFNQKLTRLVGLTIPGSCSCRWIAALYRSKLPGRPGPICRKFGCCFTVRLPAGFHTSIQV